MFFFLEQKIYMYRDAFAMFISDRVIDIILLQVSLCFLLRSLVGHLQEGFILQWWVQFPAFDMACTYNLKWFSV
jgi:hypothetical protein